MKLIQVSDLHLLGPGGDLMGIDPLERLSACVGHINTHHPDAELCIFTGDLADRGELAAYRALREAIDGLGMPYRLLIGNHDSRADFAQAFPEAVDADGFVHGVERTAAGDLILFDTHAPGAPEGRACEARLAWLRDRLGEASDRPVYVFMHHPPFDIGIPSLDRIRMLDDAEFGDVLDGHRNVRHLFFGHVHRPVAGSWRGIPFSGVRATVHQVPLDLATGAPVPYAYEPPAYAVILVEDGRTVVHYQDFLEDRVIPEEGRRRASAG